MDTHSSERHSRNTYGDIRIGGSAHVLLGDQNVSNLYQYNVGSVSLLVKPKKRLAIGQSHRLANSYRNSRAGLRRRETLGLGSSARSKEQGNVRKRYAIASGMRDDILVGQTGSTIYEQTQQLLACLYERLRKFSSIPRISVISLPEQNEEVPTPPAVYKAQEEDLVQTTGWFISPAGSDLLDLSAASLYLLLSRNLSTQGLLRLLAKCQQDQLVPLLTFLLGFDLYRYLALSLLTATPTTQYFLNLVHYH